MAETEIWLSSKQIGEMTGVHRMTAHRWTTLEGFPRGKEANQVPSRRRRNGEKDGTMVYPERLVQAWLVENHLPKVALQEAMIALNRERGERKEREQWQQRSAS